MSTTVYGCVNTTTGQVNFDVCDTADVSGCFEVTGAHAGQVKVIFSGSYCDDTYYGCVDPTTGQFQVIVPDYCCGEGYGDNCSYCPTPSETPLALLVTFSGIALCSCESESWFAAHSGNLNGSYVLTQASSCSWIGSPTPLINTTIYADPDCSGEVLCSGTCGTSYVSVSRTAGSVGIALRIYVLSLGCECVLVYGFYGGGTPSSGCVEGTYSNCCQDSECYCSMPCSGATLMGSGGSASIVELI